MRPCPAISEAADILPSRLRQRVAPEISLKSKKKACGILLPRNEAACPVRTVSIEICYQVCAD